MPNGQDDDKWHHLMTKGSRTAQGSLRLVANFKHEMIFPIEEYTSLKELLLSDNLTVIEALATVCKDHHAELACALIQIFCHYNRVLPIVNACLAKSIKKEENVATLFRASTLATMLMDQLMKLTAMDYLHSVLREPIQRIADLRDSCELDPSKLPRGTDLTPHLHLMEVQLQNILVSIFTSVDSCPLHLRYIFHCLQDRVVQKWPTDGTVRTRAVSGFLFLRLICPALINPLHFNLLSCNPSEASQRTLKLVAKAVQNLANLVEFKSKEPFMTSLNPFITRHRADMIKFIDNLSNVSSSEEQGILPSPEPARDLAAIHHLCSTYYKNLEKLAEKQPEVRNLMGLIQSLRTAEIRYLAKYRGPE
ncbi:Ras GTPase-activating protein 1 [Geodia barretti]|nr:Ras GTPase-activating protein 1 [Geodia barretti]